MPWKINFTFAISKFCAYLITLKCVQLSKPGGKRLQTRTDSRIIRLYYFQVVQVMQKQSSPLPSHFCHHVWLVEWCYFYWILCYFYARCNRLHAFPRVELVPCFSCCRLVLITCDVIPTGTACIFLFALIRYAINAGLPLNAAAIHGYTSSLVTGTWDAPLVKY